MRRSLGPGPPSKLILIDSNYGEVCDPSESLYCGKTAPNCSPIFEIYLDNLGLQGPAKRLLPGCENAVGKLRQEW